MGKVLFFAGGIHPENDGKYLTEKCSIQEPPLFSEYTVLLSQHIGAPAKPIVKKKDNILKGQKIAVAAGFISANIHAPTSGTVKDICNCPGPNGMPSPAIIIESDGEDSACEPMEPIKDWENAKPEELIKRIAEAGIVGMGGAAFPINVKLSPPKGKTIDKLILNGAECEPYLTADHRLMLESPETVIKGARLLKYILGTKRALFGIENNKKDAMNALREAQAYNDDIVIQNLQVHYPQGAEKQLIYALTGREVPNKGGLPLEVGCVVQNVGTAVAVYEAVVEGKSLYERITTVTGTPLVSPGNWKFRVGTPLSEVLRCAGGVKENPGKVILGGPMMGMAQHSLEVPISKNTSGVLLLSKDETSLFEGNPCISCGKCVDVCPMNLIPSVISLQVETEAFELAEEYNVGDCMECGSCSYVCPAKRPLVQYFKKAKSVIAINKRKSQ
ncbi:MAG: electron transport complex subunit RsxC [Verrucomicrobiota bacterium]|nr:electron transport complex subunit RsxC [Verrucomicrobiota bacterium]